MLSLLRWGLGSNHDPLSEKVRIEEEERCRSRALRSTMDSGHVKRKRGKSNQSVASQQPPAKRNPQYLSHVEVPSTRRGSFNENSTNGIDKARNSSVALTKSSSEDISDHMDLDENEQTPSELKQPSAGRSKTTKSKIKPTLPESGPGRLTRLQEVIETEFDLEILLKHNELRLIDQEIAKCQIALEQLRRCSIIQYPATTSNPQDMLNVSSGAGIPQPAVHGIPAADHPPPWGVTDGPYTRHYAQWLLPDRTFDGGFPDAPRPSAVAGKTLPERSTRGSKADSTIATPKPRTHRSTAQTRLQALPAGYPEPKEDKGPMILKRASDGKLVKLVCPNCRRENFNSAQGFINHCRIAHGHNLASHEVAARECGVEIDPNEVTIPPPDSAVPHSAQTYTPGPSTGLVHPLNRGGMVSQVPKLSMPVPRPRDRAKLAASSPTKASKTPPSTFAVRMYDHIPPSTFKPSATVPHLSHLFSKTNTSVDLSSLIDEVTKKEDLTVFSSEEEEEDDGETSNAYIGTREDHDPGLDVGLTISHAPVAMSRIPSRISTRGGPIRTTATTNNSSRPKSRKGPERVTRRLDSAHTLHPRANDGTATESVPIGQPQATYPHVISNVPTDETTPTLSPHTLESNAAPSLVSDNEDDSAHEARETETSEASSDREDQEDDEAEEEEESSMGASVDEDMDESTSVSTRGTRRKGSAGVDLTKVRRSVAKSNKKGNLGGLRGMREPVVVEEEAHDVEEMHIGKKDEMVKVVDEKGKGKAKGGRRDTGKATARGGKKRGK